ncbi:MAG TPA: hypothetical protein VKB59_08610 [Micromonosporaceae bacterium]|nr:hypothetical protein [Micromonosporaceae bacterium]
MPAKDRDLPDRDVRIMALRACRRCIELAEQHPQMAPVEIHNISFEAADESYS